MRYVVLIIFSLITIKESVGQDTALKPAGVRIYFQSVAYGSQKSIASSVVIYDTYYHKIDSIEVPKEGTYLNLPKIDLIIKVRPNEKIYRTTKAVFYAEELKDSLEIVIDPKTIDRCPINIRPILFAENSYELDSSAIGELLVIKKQLLIFDDIEHCLTIQIHSHIDVVEKLNKAELINNRAFAVINFLSQNTKINFKIIYFQEEYWYYNSSPKSKDEHSRNRCVGFKIDNRNCYHKELIIKE